MYPANILKLFLSLLQFSADVVACVRDPNTKIVSALDNWNPSSIRISDRDPTQDVVLFEGRAANGRITCRHVD